MPTGSPPTDALSRTACPELHLRLARTVPCILIALAATGAHASEADFEVRSGMFTERQHAEAHAVQVRRLGCTAELQRAFTVGEGTRWFVACPAPSTDQASLLSSRLSEQTGRPHAVIGAEVETSTGAAWDGAAVLRRIASAEEVRFTYVRQLADGRRLRHRYLRLPGMSQVEISTLDGEPWLSVRVEGDVAVYAGPDGAWSGADVYRSRRILEDLGPAQVLKPVWSSTVDPIRVALSGQVVDASVSLPSEIVVHRGQEALDRVQVEVLELDPPRPERDDVDAGT